jgi:hypothetical protein
MAGQRGLAVRSDSCGGAIPTLAPISVRGSRSGLIGSPRSWPVGCCPRPLPVIAALNARPNSSATKGPPHVRGYEYPARNVAAALIGVGNGSSYFRAARTARTSNGWARQQQAKLKPKSLGANGTLAGDWVGMFAPIVCGPVMDAEQWPDVVAFDEQPFIGSRKRQRKQSSKQETSWAIFGAFANPGDGHAGYLFRLHASPKIDAQHAADWLRSIPGRPRSSSATEPASGPKPSPWSDPKWSIQSPA